MTVMTIDTYRAISGFLPVIWPYYEKAGVDIVGIERTNAPTVWPKDIPHFAVGEDKFKRWCECPEDPFLNHRMLDTFELLLVHPFFEKYNDICSMEWDCTFARPLPPFDTTTGLCLNRAGGPMAGFKAPFFFHRPWWMDRKRAELIINKGRALIKAGDIEHGSSDVFLGLIVGELGLPWTPIHYYSVNRIDHPFYVQEARRDLAAGAIGAHGIQTKEYLDLVYQP